MTPIELVINRLEGAGLRRHGNDSDFMAQCPSHDDQSPSLHITEADDGTVLLHCIAGCRAGQIVDDLGLRLRDLFPTNGARRPGPVKPKLVPVAGGGMATRAQRDVIERETAALIREWADAFVPDASVPGRNPTERDWERAWDIAAARSGVQR